MRKYCTYIFVCVLFSSVIGSIFNRIVYFASCYRVSDSQLRFSSKLFTHCLTMQFACSGNRYIVLIQKAIDECAKNGGGVVWVPSGNYLTTSVVLRSNVNLHLDAGSALYASRRVSDYMSHKIKVGASDAEAVEVILIALNENNISISRRAQKSIQISHFVLSHIYIN